MEPIGERLQQIALMHRKETAFYAANASNGLSKDKMLAEVERSHPRKEIVGADGRVQYVKYPICATKTGCHCCLRSCRKSDLAQYGVGISLYFKFLKFLFWTFFWICLLQAPAVLFFFSATGTSQTQSTQDTISLTTLGNLGSSRSTCAVANNITSDLSIYCSYGEMDTLELFGAGTSESNCKDFGSSLILDSQCSLDTMGKATETQTLFQSTCLGKTECTIALDSEKANIFSS